MVWIFVGIAVLVSGLMVIAVFGKMPARAQLLLWLTMSVAYLGAMELVLYFFGYPGAWDVAALTIMGLLAYSSTRRRDRPVWAGHVDRRPEAEAFSDTLTITINTATGFRNGRVLAGPFDDRYLNEMTSDELSALADDLATRDPKGAAMLANYRRWRKSVT